VVLDAGAGTGHASRALKRRYPKALVIALDSSLNAARGRTPQSWLRRFARVCADAAVAAWRTAASISSSAISCCNGAIRTPCSRSFAACWRRSGFLTFTTLRPGHLARAAQRLGAGGSHSHVNQFIDMHDVGDALVRAGFAAPVLDVERFTLSYPMCAGGGRPEGHRRRQCQRPAAGTHQPAQFAAMQAAYEPSAKTAGCPRPTRWCSPRLGAGSRRAAAAG
jgi:malonyl-CoA O-methyltransferase